MQASGAEPGGAAMGALELAFASFRAGLGAFALHAFVTLALLFVGATIYVLLTPHRELKLIQSGNSAAALSLGAAIMGLALPLAAAMATSLTWADIALWGAAILLAQLIAFRLVDMLLHRLPKRIVEGEMAAATLLAAIKIAVALVMAAAVAGAPLARV